MHEDTKRYVASCPKCQRTGNISQRNSVPLKYNLQIDLFDVWGIDFMGPFKNSHGFEHILVMVDYVSKWVEAMSCRKASTEESISMIKSMIFPHFGTPRILISDGGTHFTGKNFKKCLSKLGIEHRISTAYHPQTNRQTETSNRQHPQQNLREGRQGLVKEIRWSFVGVSNSVQDTDRYDPL
jgi:transposase InsO family protein